VGYVALRLQKANVHQRDFNMDEYPTPTVIEAEAGSISFENRVLTPMFPSFEVLFSGVLSNHWQAWDLSPPQINDSIKASGADSGFDGSPCSSVSSAITYSTYYSKINTKIDNASIVSKHDYTNELKVPILNTKTSHTSSVPDGDSIEDIKSSAALQSSLCPTFFMRVYNLRSPKCTDVRPFICDHSGKAFALQHTHRRHEKQHASEGEINKASKDHPNYDNEKYQQPQPPRPDDATEILLENCYDRDSSPEDYGSGSDSGESCTSATSSEPLSCPTTPNTPEREALFLPAMRNTRKKIIDHLMDEFHSLLTSQISLRSRAGTSEGSQSEPATPERLGTTHTKRKRSGQRSDDRDGSPNKDQDDDQASKRLKTKSLKDAFVPRKLACPFYQRSHTRHQKYRSCAGPGWFAVHRVK
jgi:hypothetical protein